ncbi:sporulation membrane protein YtaF [Fictibacillus enclensis]|uniref:sporulation membrane protein YtaF n=1 Tax=Fictibacillus enclensis TaxID=1017270 RepID=UPI0024BFDE2A|nr:sporulation membrane protein YtaF [Fictibacillus enclensis]WHY70807.1 sporulation membrane protein YtaF [Fictibacillus enclensis]
MVSFSMLLLAFAVSLDSFGTGLTYGMKEIKIPIKSVLIISSCSAITFFVAMGFGHFLERFLSPQAGQMAGGIILLGLGSYFLFQVAKPDKKAETVPEEKTIVKLEIKSLGIMIQILKKPTIADLDKSGSINGWEAVLLGVALSLDAFGAGIGAAMIDMPPITTAFTVAAMSSIFVLAGIKLGFAVSKVTWMKKLTFLPGILLIIIGLMKL